MELLENDPGSFNLQKDLGAGDCVSILVAETY